MDVNFYVRTKKHNPKRSDFDLSKIWIHVLLLVVLLVVLFVDIFILSTEYHRSGIDSDSTPLYPVRTVQTGPYYEKNLGIRHFPT